MASWVHDGLNRVRGAIAKDDKPVEAVLIVHCAYINLMKLHRFLIGHILEAELCLKQYFGEIMNIKTIVICGVAALALAACQSSSGSAPREWSQASTDMGAAVKAGAKQVFVSAWKAKTVGNTAMGNTASGNDFKVYYGPDGKAKLVASGGDYKDTGTWKTGSNNTICIKWEKSKEPRCTSTYLGKDGKTTSYNTDGSKSASITSIASGDQTGS